MSKMFESSEINGMKLKNRFVRSATWEGMASPEGAVTPKLIETMRALAKGGVGLIISSHAYIRTDGQASPWQVGVYKDELIPGLKEMAAAVHEEGGRSVARARTVLAEAQEGFALAPLLLFSAARRGRRNGQAQGGHEATACHAIVHGHTLRSISIRPRQARFASGPILPSPSGRPALAVRHRGLSALCAENRRAMLRARMPALSPRPRPHG